jgi:hypothetical protein
MPSACPHHTHPELVEPVSEARFFHELQTLLLSAGVHGPSAVLVDLSFPEELRARHEKDARAYAEIQPETMVFRFAPQALYLPEANRLGLMAHEIGHLLDPAATENGADEAAERALGVRILYDPRWPGKGLQRLRRRADSR